MTVMTAEKNDAGALFCYVEGRHGYFLNPVLGITFAKTHLSVIFCTFNNVIHTRNHFF